ncbi:MAG: AfsR/SARP family transcriptional regulator, partial [Actinomycetota bacterium]|nr:AfsR/SARP family transcriptional regulator [Actinomycetota bacterium]
HARTVELLRESLVLSRRLRDTQNVAYGLEILAGALAMLGRARRAARLYGAAEALRERTGSTLVLSILRELREERLGTLREHLGEAGLAAAWAEGRALSRDEAIEEALAQGG